MTANVSAPSTVAEHMTTGPLTIGPREPLATAHRLMRRHAIRHLPVMEAGRLVGVVSQRDLYLLETLPGVDPKVEPVEEAMTEQPFSVAPDAPLADVVREMAALRYGCAVVMEEGALVGIFTTTDALEMLGEACL